MGSTIGKIYAVGNEEQLGKLIVGLSAMRDSMFQLTFDKIIPTPTTGTGEIIDDWYNWRLEHWGGCKSEPEIIVNELCAGFEADTFKTIKVYSDFHKKTPLEVKNALENLSQHGLISWECKFEIDWGFPIDIFNKVVEDYKDEIEILSIAYVCDADAGILGKWNVIDGKVSYLEYYADVDNQREAYIREALSEEFLTVKTLLTNIEMNLRMRAVIDGKQNDLETEEFNKRLIEKMEIVFNKYKDLEDYGYIAKLYVEAMYGAFEKEDDEKEEC